VVEPREITDSIRAAILAARPDGRYALEGAGFAPTWIVSPDYGEEQLSLRDLLTQVYLGGPVIAPGSIVYPVSILVVLAAYHGDRTSSLSGRALSCFERLHGAALHLGEVLASTSLDCGGMLAFLGYETPSISEPPDFVTTSIILTLIIPR